MTSALPYIHGVPHLGNIVGSILPADIVHRFLDVKGVENIFICGSDEHGTPLELAALEADVPVEEYADRQHEAVKTVLADFDMDFSLYGRTHTEYNRKQTTEMFVTLYENDYIVEKEQELPYCTDCERFLPDRYIEGECPHCGGLARGDQCDDQGCGKLLDPKEVIDPHCTICDGKNIEFRSTKNLFLRLPRFEEGIREWLEQNDPIPQNLKKEVFNLLDEGLEDRCITRDISWGFPVPYDRCDGLDEEVYGDKVLYVWFDAPIGYIGITRQFLDQEGDEQGWERFWKHNDAETVYSLGKDNTIFHTVIWPAILLGQHDDYTLPDYEFIHQYLLSDDVQFSKSRGTGLDSRTALDLLPADYWRFYLASVLPAGHDSTFSWTDFEARINGDLNDTVGNYVNRVLSLADKWFDNHVPEKDVTDLEPYARTFLEAVNDTLETYEKTIHEERDLKKGLKHAVRIARLGDEFLSEQEPWHNEDRQDDVIFACLQSLTALAAALYPYTPTASSKIWEMLDADGEITGEKDLFAAFRSGKTYLDAGAELGDREILFEKVDTDELAARIAEEDDDGDEGDDEMTDDDMVSFDEFKKLDLRTATIKTVEEHPNADRLYILQVDIGGEVKQSCAGLKEHFEKDELEGRKVIALANLEPAELRGEVSECMIMAVETEEGDVIPLSAGNVPDGLRVH